MRVIGVIVRNVWLIFGQTGWGQEKSVTLFVAQSVALYLKVSRFCDSHRLPLIRRHHRPPPHQIPHDVRRLD